ncbi:hypothetical protein HDU79_010919 [Rhizoclosmatium sp. JEL0117]|nr:hypothetical protein HDU79_010919 [Rhizoclosmatium sp. JEL0117]
MGIDINLFRVDKGGNADIVRESQRKRFAPVKTVDELIQLDNEWKTARFVADEKNKDINTLQKEITALMKSGCIQNFGIMSRPPADSRCLESDATAPDLGPSDSLTLPHLFRATASQYPHKDALVFAATSQRMNYKETLETVENLASCIRSAISNEETAVIGVLIEKSLELTLAILAITFAGYTWLPFDPDAPAERVAVCLKDAGASCLIFDEVHDSIAKSVLAGQSSCMSLPYNQLNTAAGATVIVAERGQWRDVVGLCQVWRKFQVSVVCAVPTLMAMVCMDGDSRLIPESVRVVNVGGEACPASLVTSLHRPGLQVFNTYGPSETTVTATYKIVYPDKQVTIGRPLPFYHCLILTQAENEQNFVAQQLTPGTTGELAIGGSCLSSGYVGRVDLTTSKFIPHPTRPGEIIYRTGDLVSLNENMDIVFIGRVDTQVKYRGFRIELGEIEERLSMMAGISAAAVILSPGLNESDSPRLEAYLVLSKGVELNAAQIRKGLSGRLMAYMIPDTFTVLDEFDMPRLLSGKIDKKGLQEISKANRQKVKTSSQDESMIPTSSEEMALSTLRKLFNNAAVKPTDDFFIDLGGHSLLAANFISKLRAGIPQMAENPYANASLVDLYTLRTAQQIAQKYPMVGISPNHSNLPLEPFHKIKHWRYILCGLIQGLLLIPLWCLYGFVYLGPFLIWSYSRYRKLSQLYSILLMFAYTLAIHPLMSLIALCLKWILLGRVKPGRYPLWGSFYIRWWLVHSVMRLPAITVGDSTLMPMWYRLMGARIGKDVHMGQLRPLVCADLLEIEDRATVSREVFLGVEMVEGGYLKLRRIKVCHSAVIRNRAVLEGDTEVGEASEVACMACIPAESVVPSFEKWYGSPAVFHSNLTEDSSDFASPGPIRKLLVHFMYAFLAFVAIPAINFIPVVPVSIFFNLKAEDFNSVASVSPLAAILFIVLIVLQTILLRWITAPFVYEGIYHTMSWFYIRKWFIDTLVNNTIVSLHAMYATLYATPFLRLLGVKIGKRCEISTAHFANLSLIEIGNECFLADYTAIGEDEIRGYKLTLERTVLEDRSFVGNSALIPQGYTLPTNSLVGVASVPPEKSVTFEKGTTVFGNPPILIPRQNNVATYADKLLFTPSMGLVASRFFIETIRILLPSVLLMYGIGFGIQAFDKFSNPLQLFTPRVLYLLPLYFLSCFVVPSILIMLILKWVLIGKYKPAEYPMWSLNVWLTETVVSVCEAVSPYSFTLFAGTPFLSVIYRLFGMKVGKRVYFGSVDIPEFDCLEIGDDACFNYGGFPQTHLFEDRIMKIARCKIGARVTMKLKAISLAEEIQDDAVLGSNSVAMRGEILGGGLEWYGAPAQIYQRGRSDSVIVKI